MVKTTVKKIAINKIICPWGNEEKAREEVRRAIEDLSDNPQAFNCKKCGALYQPQPNQWIFYRLCDVCFMAFDKQKMLGRIATLSKKNGYAKHFEDVDEWIKHKEN